MHLRLGKLMEVAAKFSLGLKRAKIDLHQVKRSIGELDAGYRMAKVTRIITNAICNHFRKKPDVRSYASTRREKDV